MTATRPNESEIPVPAKLVKRATSVALGIVAMMLLSPPSRHAQAMGSRRAELSRASQGRRAPDRPITTPRRHLSPAVSAALLARGLRW